MLQCELLKSSGWRGRVFSVTCHSAPCLLVLHLFTLTNGLAPRAKRLFCFAHLQVQGSAPKCHYAGGDRLVLLVWHAGALH